MYIQYVYTQEVRMSTSGINIHIIGWSCQPPCPHEIHCCKWEICVRSAWCFSGT